MLPLRRARDRCERMMLTRRKQRPEMFKSTDLELQHPVFSFLQMFELKYHISQFKPLMMIGLGEAKWRPIYITRLFSMHFQNFRVIS